MRCLIVEDERHLNDLLHDYVKASFPSAQVDQIFDGYDALIKIREEDFDIVLLDVMLPNVDGFALAKELRRTSQTPIILLSALSDEDNQVRGYDLGIDEFVPKPYSPKLVIKKMTAILSRHQQTDQETKTIGILTYNIPNRTIQVNDEDITLNKKEWDLLCLFVEHPGRLFTREDLLNKVWGYDYFGDARTVDTHIKRLRQKLQEANSYIKTVFKEGYKFEV